MSRDSTTITVRHQRIASCPQPRNVPALLLVWSAMEPQRVGEVALIDPRQGPRVFGRGAPTTEAAPLVFAQQRPANLAPQPDPKGPGISRRQLLLSPGPGQSLQVQSVGRCPVHLHGRPVQDALLQPGDVLELEQQLTLLCVSRPLALPALDAYPEHAVPLFGEPDAFGIVGESPALWKLREQLAFAALANQHVLLVGESGTGKELAARAIHGLSPRAFKPMVARNAATLPPGILDAELFGNVRDYPNAGMRERPGLIGEADESTLFLDEIGEMPQDLQAHLLRVLDSDGEYQRLGDARTRRARLRLVVATNREPTDLKHDLLARLTLRLSVPGLEVHPEDIPLLARRLVLLAARGAPNLGDRFVEGWDGQTGEPRLGQKLVSRLLGLTYDHHVRDLDQVLWRAMSTSSGNVIDDTAEVREAFPVSLSTPAEPSRAEPRAEDVREALNANQGNITRAARQLGLPNRYALYRLMRKLEIDA